MKSKILYITLLLGCMICTPSVKGQILKKLAEDALNKAVKKAVIKAVSSGVNKPLKTSTVKIGQKVFAFEERNDAKITQIGHSSNKTWNVYIENSNGGIQEYISTVYWDRNYQLLQNYKYRGSGHSFDLLRENDTCMAIYHNITSEPFKNKEYPDGAKCDLFKIKDSVIYKITIDADRLQTEINNLDLSEYIPVIKFSEGKIYDLENANELGTYNIYVPSKLNFIITSLYFIKDYGKMDESLLTLKLMNLKKAQNDWLDKQKSCDQCSKNFSGSVFMIESKQHCKIENEGLGFNLLTGKYIDDTDNIFCSEKCAEKFCIDLKK